MVTAGNGGGRGRVQVGMDMEAALAFAREQPRGVLITLKRDGRPQASNIMFAVGGDGVVRISVTEDRAKTANMRRDPRVALHVTAPDFGRYVVLEGDADLTPPAAAPGDDTVDQLVELYRSLQGDHPDWDEYRRAMVADRRVVVRLRPTHAYGTA